MANLAQRRDGERAGSCRVWRVFEGGLTHRRPNGEPAILPADIVELGDAVDIDEMGGSGESEVHQGDQALSPGEDAALLTQRGEDGVGFIQARGQVIDKRRRFHAPLPPRSIAVALRTAQSAQGTYPEPTVPVQP